MHFHERRLLVMLKFSVLLAVGLFLVACEPVGPAPTPSGLDSVSFTDLKERAASPTYDALFRNNEEYVGQLVHYQAQLIQVLDAGDDRYQLRANITRSPIFWDDTVFLRYAGSRFLENDIIEFVGTVVGLVT